MSYSSVEACQARLADVEAIDYFLARQLQRDCVSHCQNNPDDELFFHIVLALHWHLRQGHSLMPLSAIAGRPLFVDESANKNGYYFPEIPVLSDCLSGRRFDDQAPLVWQDDGLYLRRYWQFEQEVSADLRARCQSRPLSADEKARAQAMVQQCFPVGSSVVGEPDWQKVAVANALGRRLSVIAGGPGTGKTYTVTRVLLALQAVAGGTLRIRMAAPTGKAAQRLNESIQQAKAQLRPALSQPEWVDSLPDNAMTLHRLLGYRPDQIEPRHHRGKPLLCDVLLIDEVSMIDLPMMARVLRALPDQATLILLGDAEQLPSVEVGAVMADLTPRKHPGYPSEVAGHIADICGEPVPENDQSAYEYLTILTKTWRFGGLIGQLANAVIRADAASSWSLLQANALDKHTAAEAPELTYVDDRLFDAWLNDVCHRYIKPVLNAATLEDAFVALSAFRLLSPTRVGERGVEKLNARIEEILGRTRHAVRTGRFYAGRPIMVTENHYGVGLYNGDVGLVWPDSQGRLQAWFEDEQATYRQVSLARLPSVETVYAMTIHKTQGSEFAHAAIVLPNEPNPVLSPELLYTGITRAKKQVTMVGSQRIWFETLARQARRYSGLARSMLNR